MLTIQVIQIQWRSEAHNPACATERNRLPRALPLPSEWLDCRFGSIHQQDFYALDTSSFMTTAANSNRFRLCRNCLTACFFSEENQTLKVWFADEQGVHGLPIHPRRHLFALHGGQTAQFRINGRAPIGFDDDAIYQQHTYNIAYRTHGDERLFVSKSFDCSVSLEAVLF